MVPEFVPRHAKIPEKMIFGSMENAKKKRMAIDGR